MIKVQYKGSQGEILKKAFLALSVLLLICAASFAETNPPASIKNTESWIPKNSPYIIDGTVTVENTGFLTIYPGTVIKFKPGAKIFVKGALYSKGDPKNPVRMLPYDNESFYDGLVFESRYKNTVEFTIMIRGTIVSRGSQLNLNNNYILNSTGVELYHFSNALIRDNYFYNDTYGVYIEGKEVNYTIGQNTFNNNRFAIYIKNTPKPLGIITKNNFFKNIVNITNYSVADVDCRDNYWGYSEEAAVQEFIYDKKNNEKAGRAVYAPFEKSPYKLWEPTDAFISLVKIYLNLKRPDEEPQRMSIGGGAVGLLPVTPSSVSKQYKFGLGLDADFYLNLRGSLLTGLEFQSVTLDNSKGDIYDHMIQAQNFMASCIQYIGYKRNVYFVPYIKIGIGGSIISDQLKNSPTDTKKSNQLALAADAGAGFEWFILKFFSLKLEASYTAITANTGLLSYPVAGITGNLYFDTPLFLDDKGTGGPY
jgi:opacity protein-like surface antigen